MNIISTMIQHLCDRLIYIVLWIISLRVPLFLILFTFLTLVSLAQVHIPGIYSFGMTDSLIFWGTFEFKFSDSNMLYENEYYLYLLLLISLHFSFYFYAGVAKLSLSPNGFEYFLMDYNILFKQALIDKFLWS